MGRPLGDASAFVYDGNGNLTQMTDLAYGQTNYSYDSLDRLAQITLPNGAGTVAYTYDAAGRVTSITTGGNTVSLRLRWRGKAAHRDRWHRT